MKVMRKITTFGIGFTAMLYAIGLLAPQAFAYNNESRSVGVTARIAFVQPINTTKVSDIVISGVDMASKDSVSLSADGNVQVKGRGNVVSNDSKPGVLNIGDTRNSVINLVTTAYNLGTGVSAMKASYKADGATLDKPLIGKSEQTVYIGMDMVVEDVLAASSRTDTGNKSSFDVSIVYQ